MGEEDGLAADRVVAALRPADVVLGHQDPAAPLVDAGVEVQRQLVEESGLEP